MKRIFAIISVMLPLFAAVSCVYDDPEPEFEIKIGETIPDFTVTMNDGTTVTGASLRNGVSIIMFFHTSCPDCRQVLPQMQKVYDEYASAGVRIVLISREDSKESVESFWRENGLKMPYSAQNDRKVYEKFAATRIPRVYVNEKGGIIRYVFTDDPNPSYDEICTALENVIR